MKIRKIIWILSGILLIIALMLSSSTIKKHYTVKKLKDIQAEEEMNKEEKEDEEEEVLLDDDDAMEEAEETASEDPVRDFLSERVQKAIKLFLHNDLKIVAIGDSLTQGIGDEAENNGYIGILSDTINQEQDLVEIENFGKRGNRSDQLIARLQEPEIEEALREADIILITIGANDIMQIFKENFTDLTMEKFANGKMNYENRLESIFFTMEENNASADIYLIGFYNPFEKHFSDIEELDTIVNSWNAVGESVTEQFSQVSYIPTNDLFTDTSINYLSEDNFHPNHLGYELIAERVLQYITNEGEGDEQTE